MRNPSTTPNSILYRRCDRVIIIIATTLTPTVTATYAVFSMDSKRRRFRTTTIRVRIIFHALFCDTRENRRRRLRAIRTGIIILLGGRTVENIRKKKKNKKKNPRAPIVKKNKDYGRLFVCWSGFNCPRARWTYTR